MNSHATVETQIGADGVLDVCALPCAIKHGLIIRTCLNLPIGGSFVLLNGHDPLKVLKQIDAEWPESFAWEHLVNRADECRVKITKLQFAAAKVRMPAALVCSH